jgi:sulfite exporter TauE/SafE
MPGGLTLAAALLLGLAASGHCIVMCGGIAGALGSATSPRADGRPRALLLASYQAGRIASYAILGLVVGGVFGALIAALDVDLLRRVLRVLAALALGIAALVAFGRIGDGAARIGQRLWRHVAPLGRRLLPVTSVPRAAGFGLVWGLMPCGFVYTVLLIAVVQASAWSAALTMLAFGIGTMPAMFATAMAGHALVRRRGPALARSRALAGTLLVAGAALTLTGPAIVDAVPALAPWMPFLCGTDVH